MLHHARRMKRLAYTVFCALVSCWADDSMAKDPQQAAPTKERSTNARVTKNEELVRQLQARIQALEAKIDSLVKSAPPSSQQVQPPPPSENRAEVARPEAQGPPAGTRSRSSAVGSFDVDPQAAQRALERTLTQAGALLLPAGTIELTPIFSYALSERDTSVLGTLSTPGSQAPITTILTQRTRTNETAVAASLRMGLPYSLQAEAYLPYSHVRTLRTDDFGDARSARGFGLGDASVGLAKTLFREQSWRPDLVGRLSYNFGSGRKPTSLLGFSGGYRQLQGQLIALKRQDPLAFTAEASYYRFFESDGTKPGDIAILGLVAALAASPETSLQLGFTQLWRGDIEVQGIGRPGTSQNYGLLTIGASSVLTRDLTAVTQFAIGVGRDAPKYSFSLAFPFLFR